MRPFMSVQPLFSVVLAFVLAACGQERLPAETQTEPRVSLVHFEHQVRFAGASGQLERGEPERLARFIGRENVGYGDQISLIVPESAAFHRELLAQRQKAVPIPFMRAGAQMGEVFVSEGSADAAEEVRVLVTRHVVTPPSCPNWQQGRFDAFNNQVTSNFGCATSKNLAVMVANPGDLLQGQRTTPADGEAMSLSIRRYQQGKVTPLKFLDSKGEVVGGSK